jgi:hypothetical protein
MTNADIRRRSLLYMVRLLRRKYRRPVYSVHVNIGASDVWVERIYKDGTSSVVFDYGIY